MIRGEGGVDTLGLIARDDLVATLDRAAAAGKVTIISAPAGSGKTALLQAWANRTDLVHRVACVPVRGHARDAQDFWLTLLNAVCHSPGAAAGTEAPAAAPDADVRTLADRVLAELAGQRDRVTVIMDDLHELSSPESLAQVTRLLANLPPNVHVIVATRRDLRLRLPRLRLAGELAEIRAADLAFSEDETRELLAASGVTLSEAGAALLHQRTGGWAAGLRLAVLSLAGHPDPERFVADFSGSHRTVADYLLAEMLESQPGEVQDLLLRTCLLEQVNGELADLLTDRQGTERILLDLEDANAFVVSTDPGRTWFRYHQLFADLLRLQLRRTMPEQVPGLHRRAAIWFAGHGQMIDTIRHTQKMGDWPEAARLLADHAFSLTLDGHTQTMQALVQAFPPGADRPELALVRADGDLVRGRLDDAAAHLAAAEAYAETVPPDRQRRLRTVIETRKLSLARRRGHMAGVIEQSRLLASPRAGQSGEDIACGRDLRAVALLNLGTAEAWSPGLTDAERHLQEGAALARQIGRPYLEVGFLAQLGFASRHRPFATARRRCREAIVLAEHHGWGSEPVIAPALVTLAGRLIWTGEFDEGERWLRRAARALQTDTGPDTRLLLHQVTGLLHAARGRHREALEEFTAAEHLGTQLADPHVLASQVTGWLLATRARLGMLSEADAALAALSDEQVSAGELGSARAVIRLADGDPAGALAALRDVLDGTAPVIGDITRIEAQLLAALAHRRLGEQNAANRAAERALALAEPDRLVVPFAMIGSRALLETLPRHQTAHAALLIDILDILRGSPLLPRQGSAPLAAELSPSELKVLRYLPTNLSRHEIANELSVSLNTVSTHLRNIYAKLSANDRSMAVHRARELRLLAGDRPR